MRFLPFSNAIVFSSCLMLLAACGGDTSSSTSSGSGAGAGTTTTTSATTTSTASLHWGAAGGETGNHVINSSVSVLDANGASVDMLDGGDFRIIAPKSDYEGFHRAQKMDFDGTHVTGHLILMLDISNNMSAHFSELKGAAVKLVNDAVAIGLPVTVYAFSTSGSVDPAFPVGLVTAVDVGTATTVTDAINLLTPTLGNTFLYESVATILTDRLTLNLSDVVYDHATPATLPTSHVEMMVIMSDGLDSSSMNSTGDVTALSEATYWIHSIAVGDKPDTGALQTISTYPITTTVPDGGTYNEAVNSAMTFIENFYNGFYLIEYQTSDTSNTALSYEIRLFDNDNSKLTHSNIDVTAIWPNAWLTPVCCEVWAAPGEGVDATATVTINATLGNTMEFQVVQLWSNILNTGSNVTWALSGNMTGQQDPTDPTRYTITTTGNTGSGSLTATVGGWSSTIPITLN